VGFADASQGHATGFGDLAIKLIHGRLGVLGFQARIATFVLAAFDETDAYRIDQDVVLVLSYRLSALSLRPAHRRLLARDKGAAELALALRRDLLSAKLGSRLPRLQPPSATAAPFRGCSPLQVTLLRRSTWPRATALASHSASPFDLAAGYCPCKSLCFAVRLGGGLLPLQVTLLRRSTGRRATALASRTARCGTLCAGRA
jgi:hypothetical protein